MTTAQRDAAEFMSLEGVATSAGAKQLVSSLGEGFDSRTRRGPSRLPIPSRLSALGAIVCDLIRHAGKDRLQFSYRPVGRDAFTGERVGYRPFTWAFDELEHHQCIQVFGGHQQWGSLGDKPSNPRVKTWKFATRLRATPWLMKRASECGITPENWEEHFEIVPNNPAPDTIIAPLQLRGPSIRIGGRKVRGPDLPIDLTDPTPKALHDRVVCLNNFVAKHTIEGAKTVVFARVFNEGGTPAFNWNMGGRLGVANGGGYQNMSKEDRKAITINGEPVVELDVTASHVGILHALSDAAFDPSVDPYDVPGIPRGVAKAWVTMTLGHTGLHRRWTPDAGERQFKTLGRKLGKAYPYRMVEEAMLSRLPIMRDWNESKVRWPHLQYAESRAIIAAVETLAFDHNVASLPVHDSIIVPAIHKELARGIIIDSYKADFGYEPLVKEG